MQQTAKKTESNYDLLRIICAFTIIVLHVTAIYLIAYTNQVPYQRHITFTIVCDIFTTFAIPCFMLLSGAFLLANDKNQNYKFFYQKSFKKIGIPSIIFSVFYFTWLFVLALRSFIFTDRDFSVLWHPIDLLLKGQPFYHMWYVYTLIGIYLLIPVLIKLKLDIGEKRFAKFCWIYFVVAMICGNSFSSKYAWSVARVAVYLGFILAGYQIRRITKEKKSNFKGIAFILSSCLLLSVMTFIQYQNKVVNKLNGNQIAVSGHFNAFVVVAALLLFVGFSYLSFNSNVLGRISKYTFYIYLIHAGVWEILQIVYPKIMHGLTDPIYTIPMLSLVVFAVSFLLSFIYIKLWGLIDKNERVSNKFCKIFHLQ